MTDAVVVTVHTIEDLGKKQYQDFLKERINTNSKMIDGPTQWQATFQIRQ